MYTCNNTTKTVYFLFYHYRDLRFPSRKHQEASNLSNGKYVNNVFVFS